MLENFDQSPKNTHKPNDNTQTPSNKVDLIRKVVGPVILAASALSMNAAAQSSQDTLRQAEQLGKQAQSELRRASVLHTQQGILLMTIGNLVEAKKMFIKALELDSTNKEAQDYLDRLNKDSV